MFKAQRCFVLHESRFLCRQTQYEIVSIEVVSLWKAKHVRVEARFGFIHIAIESIIFFKCRFIFFKFA